MKIEEGILFADRYRLLDLLGVGGFSEVWKAEDVVTHMIVAIKIFLPDSSLDERGQEVFKSEYSLVFNLHHPNLLPPVHFDEWQGKPYLLMPFMSNGSCARRLGQFNEAEIVRFLSDIGGALAYLHQQQPPILHRDIKPDNILIDDNGHYRLSDFGISSRLRNTLTRTGSGRISTSLTLAYAAPDLFGKNPEPTEASDIWALGATLFELVTGTLPFGPEGGLLQKKGAEIPELHVKIAKGLCRLICNCLNPDPSVRPSALKLSMTIHEFINKGIWENLEIETRGDTLPLNSANGDVTSTAPSPHNKKFAEHTSRITIPAIFKSRKKVNLNVAVDLLDDKIVINKNMLNDLTGIRRWAFFFGVYRALFLVLEGFGGVLFVFFVSKGSFEFKDPKGGPSIFVAGLFLLGLFATNIQPFIYLLKFITRVDQAFQNSIPGKTSQELFGEAIFFFRKHYRTVGVLRIIGISVGIITLLLYLI